MARHATRILMALLLCAVLAGPGAAQTPPSGPLWSDSGGAQAPADIVRCMEAEAHVERQAVRQQGAAAQQVALDLVGKLSAQGAHHAVQAGADRRRDSAP